MSDPRQVRHERREQLYARLLEEYSRCFPASRAFHERATTCLVDGGSHAVRMFSPFPYWVHQAQGAHVRDLDDHDILDFWQGHFANILGHNPRIVTQVLTEALQLGHALQSGMQDVWEWELADLLCRRTGAEMVRFTTSGTLATMYAILLARGYTGRSLVLKQGGGWHGAQPWGLKGVHFGSHGYADAESAGLPDSVVDEVLVTRFNDVQVLEDVFRQYGDRIACFILEPWIGSGAGLPAQPEYLHRARELSGRYGALLILDEVIAGFRFRAGTCASLYGIQPDLTTLGKIIGGGMPVAAVAGRAEIMKFCSKAGGRRVRFDGGTYSAHPLSLLAGRTMIQYLVEHEQEIYPRLGAMGARLRQAIECAYAEEGVVARCTGASEALPDSSLVWIQYPYRPDLLLEHSDTINDPANNDVEMRERVSKLAFLLEGVFTVHGLGALTMAHTDEDLWRLERACHAVGRRLKAAGLAEER